MMELYWVEAPDRDEDAFVIANSHQQAERFAEDSDGYDRGASFAIPIARIPKHLAETIRSEIKTKYEQSREKGMPGRLEYVAYANRMDWLSPLGFEEVMHCGRYVYLLDGSYFYFNNYQDFQKGMGWNVKDDTIKNLSQLVREVCKLSDGRWYFRGQRNAAWSLESSLFRESNAKQAGNNILQFERLMLDRVKAILAPKLTFKPTSDLEWLMIAQHHGAPTRLLDWSRQLLTALFFAVHESTSDRDACVACLRHDRKPVHNLSLSQMQKSKKIEIAMASNVSDRIIHQDSVFTLEPNEIEDGRWANDNAKVFIINANHVSKIEEQLAKLGVTREHLFPGLDSSVARAVQDARETTNLK